MLILFLLGVALLATHELDAIYRHEWRLFFGWTPLSDESAYRLFTLLHVPLFVFLYYQAARGDRWFENAFDAFLMIHVGLHFAFRRHPQNEFRNAFSQTLIWGAGATGLLHLVLSHSYYS